MSGTLVNFDRSVALAELLRSVPSAKLKAALDGMLVDGWRIVDADEVTISQSHHSHGQPEIALPLRVEIDTVGWLAASERCKQQAYSAVQWLEMVLANAHRYQMAADLHLEAVHADYAALQAKHAALQISEERYRTLSAELERRVQEQVAVIENVQRRLYRSAQISAISSLAAGMAHEINNPIGFIRSNLGTALTYLNQFAAILQAFRSGDGSQALAACGQYDIDYVMTDFRDLLSESAAGAERVARIVSRLKTFSNVERSVGATDLNDTVRVATDLLLAQLPAGISLQLDLKPLPLLTCDSASISQAMFALLQNARQALEADGTILVSSCASGDDIRIAIRDNGCGMSESLRERIFEPFFTTREVGNGMGLGLTMANDIVRAHRGSIEVESHVGVGSTVTVFLPWRPASAETGKAQ